MNLLRLICSTYNNNNMKARDIDSLCWTRRISTLLYPWAWTEMISTEHLWRNTIRRSIPANRYRNTPGWKQRYMIHLVYTYVVSNSIVILIFFIPSSPQVLSHSEYWSVSFQTYTALLHDLLSPPHTPQMSYWALDPIFPLQPTTWSIHEWVLFRYRTR